MKKSLLVALALLVATLTINAQLISQFTWEGTDPKAADAGPNASSISSYAYISSGGANGTNGLNPGSGSHDINMIIPGANFKVSSLDISVDFKRKESDAVFFTLGSLDFGINGGNLHAKFLISKNGTDTLISLMNLYSVPSDNAFHTYRFVYNAPTGLATVTVDGNSVASYSAPASTALSWTSATDVTVGKLMDGTGSNIAILDNLIVKNPLGYSTLPVTLESFTAVNAGAANKLTWIATNEIQLLDYQVQRSTDGISFETIGSVAAQQLRDYQYIDNSPAATSFYRLRMIDIDGSFRYSEVKKLSTQTPAAISVSCYPNPVVNFVNIRITNAEPGAMHYLVATLDGRTLQSGEIQITGADQQLSLNLSTAPKGIILVSLQATGALPQSFKIWKQ